MGTRFPGPPPGAALSSVEHRVPFFETDAMGIVHHANHLRYLELARVRWMDDHHLPYVRYVEEGTHLTTTHVELRYLRGVRFDETVTIDAWLTWVRGASLGMGYALRVDGTLVAHGATEHACVDEEGRPRRIPAERRRALRALAPKGA